MKITIKSVLLFLLIFSSIQSVRAIPLNAQSCQQPAEYTERNFSASRLLQGIDIPEGLPILLLILIPICGGGLLIGVLMIVLLLRRGKKKHPSAAPPVMAAPPSMTPSTAVPSPPQMAQRCANCGAQMSPQAKFCNRCGTPLTATPVPEQQSFGYHPHGTPPVPNAQPAVQPYSPVSVPNAVSAPRAEPVIGIIAGLAQQKGLSARQYNLIVTQQRLIFARLTDQMLKGAMDQAKQEAKAEGRGFFGQWGSLFKANAKLCERYYQMPIDLIVRENPENFVLYPQQIRKVRIQIANAFDETNNNIDRLVIQAGSRMTFLLKGTNARETKQILRNVLGNIVK